MGNVTSAAAHLPMSSSVMMPSESRPVSDSAVEPSTPQMVRICCFFFSFSRGYTLGGGGGGERVLGWEESGGVGVVTRRRVE